MMQKKHNLQRSSKITLLLFIVGLVSVPVFAQDENSTADGEIFIEVDLNKKEGAMTPIWAWWGYDEPNYTYMKDGKKLLSEIADLSAVPVYVRAHSLLVTDEGPRAALKSVSYTHLRAH